MHLLRGITLVSLFIFSVAHAEGLDDLNPKSPDIDQTLRQMDLDYENETGLSPWLGFDSWDVRPCYRATCATWARVSRQDQLFHLYINGTLQYTWSTSTGRTGYETPPMDRHPTGRIYDAYTSTIYPGGNFKGLGNMPYAVFILGGYAIHGTPRPNWPFLGSAVSAGCVRLLPANAKIFNRLVRANGRGGVWVTVE